MVSIFTSNFLHSSQKKSKAINLVKHALEKRKYLQTWEIFVYEVYIGIDIGDQSATIAPLIEYEYMLSRI